MVKLKTIVFLIVICLFTSIRSSKAQQHMFTVVINQQNYQVSEQQLNDFFGEMFELLVSDKTCKQKDFDLWRASFERWKVLAGQGKYQFVTYGSVMGSISYQGSAGRMDMGLSDDGTPATGNPNKPKNMAHRMAILNHFMGKYIASHIVGLRIE